MLIGGYGSYPGYGAPGMPGMQNPAISSIQAPPTTNSPKTAEAGGAKKKDGWSEHKAPDGRLYFYNEETKQSSWEKPDALKTPAEVVMSYQELGYMFTVIKKFL